MVTTRIVTSYSMQVMNTEKLTVSGINSRNVVTCGLNVMNQCLGLLRGGLNNEQPARHIQSKGR